MMRPKVAGGAGGWEPTNKSGVCVQGDESVMKSHRVFLGLTEVAGYYRNLKRGFSQLGVACTFVNLEEHPFQYGGHETNVLVRAHAWLGRRRKRGILAKLVAGLQTADRLLLFLWALVRHDAFIFGFNTTFLRRLDLPVLKLFRKTVIFVYHGTDCRPPYLNGVVIGGDQGPSDLVDRCLRLVRRTKKRIRRAEKYADCIVNFPPQSHFLHKPFVIAWALGLPCEVETEEEEEEEDLPPREGQPVRILHCPSMPIVKGTARIQRAIENLRRRGHRIDFVEITGQPNQVVLAEIQKCDFVVDQAYSDTPMAGFAAEAACLGKPSVVGGYYAERIAEEMPEAFIAPTCFCHPDELEEAIEKLILDKEFRLELGRKAQRFIRSQWAPRKVAERYLRLIDGETPAEWVYDPHAIRYLHGVGVSDERVKAMVGTLVHEAGLGALGLSDKPELEERFRQLVDRE